jgi:hypothetical protein
MNDFTRFKKAKNNWSPGPSNRGDSRNLTTYELSMGNGWCYFEAAVAIMMYKKMDSEKILENVIGLIRQIVGVGNWSINSKSTNSEILEWLGTYEGSMETSYTLSS